MTPTVRFQDHGAAFLAWPPRAGNGGARDTLDTGYRAAGPHPTERLIRGFERLDEGWHFGRGAAPAKETIARALDLHKAAIGCGFMHTDAFPGEGGEVQVTVYPAHGECLEFTIAPSGAVDFIHERGEAIVVEHEGLSVAEAVQQLRELASQSWMSSAFSTSSITTRPGAGLLVWRSQTVPGAAYLFSTRPAR